MIPVMGKIGFAAALTVLATAQGAHSPDASRAIALARAKCGAQFRADIAHGVWKARLDGNAWRVSYISTPRNPLCLFREIDVDVGTGLAGECGVCASSAK